MFRFAYIENLYLLLLVPALALAFVIIMRLRRLALRRFASTGIIKQLIPEVSPGRHILKFILLILALSSVIIGVARPQFGSKLREIKREGVEIIIALDVSNSMMAEDIKPNRLERAKQAIARLVDRLVNDKIGLIVFAGDAYIQIPITTDYVSAKLFLSAIDTDIVPKQGTAIGSAIELAAKSFGPGEETGKALIIITDGENHEDDAIEAARMAAEKGIRVHTVGVGLPQGAPIPVNPGSGRTSFRKDRDGNTIISKLNDKMLQEIAAAGQGVYIRSSEARLGLNTLFDEINRMEKQELEAKIYSDYDERFQYFFGLALLLLVIEFFILNRKNRWMEKIKLFE
jgi:Ca-activated chloride channel family protein